MSATLRLLPLTLLLVLLCAATAAAATVKIPVPAEGQVAGDLMADARDAAGATDPDPGCSGPADTSENSEVGLPAGCTVELSIFNGDEQFPGIAVAGCGSIKSAWFKPSAAPVDCHYAIGAAASATCTVTGATAGATFAATSQEVLLAMHTTTRPQCGPVTAAITLADGRVASYRDDWC
jgi:hypothetical protein